MGLFGKKIRISEEEEANEPVGFYDSASQKTNIPKSVLFVLTGAAAMYVLVKKKFLKIKTSR